jgi:hypothetical protein
VTETFETGEAELAEVVDVPAETAEAAPSDVAEELHAEVIESKKRSIQELSVDAEEEEGQKKLKVDL